MKVYWIILCSVLPVLAQDARTPWERINQFDHNNDGKVSRDEFTGRPALFDRLDQNHDGFVTRAEAEAMRRQGAGFGKEGPGLETRTAGPMLFPRLDRDGNKKISRSEWSDFFKQADLNGDDFVDMDEWQALTRQQPFRDNAPAVGTPAPSVKLKSLRTGQIIDVSAVRRPTVLVFGSYT